ncbi:hypothetical protein C8N24_0865 [Solirubrobacter pauli]|uniref:Uncharacterized protein n=1 Tax=Solirubrobacter pauli TaxID=166793 RepID=A0A660L951_9ACTN|nr:hypothetical protein [Solirubrobacter pauli]RKQ91049.1 hypothetical protein C8N24_0865 [Solirubrobacter pauli]
MLRRRPASLVIALLAVLSAAPAASADTQYGGSGLYKGKAVASPSITLTLRDDGTAAARVAFAYSCRRVANFSFVMRLTGRVQGSSFTVTGRTRTRGLGTIRVSLRGTATPADATGNARVRVPGCKGYTNPFVVRTESAPAGAPAAPAPGTLAQGFTSQSAAAFRMPVALRVAGNGRVYARWGAVLTCGRVKVPMVDVTPTRAIKPDGTFGGSETYTIRYRGYSERYRVTFRGQFLADGVKGTLRATMRARRNGRALVPCRTGAHTWTARAT